ncbi:MAG TPA: polysaccharide deacetylase [Candidatus Acidoferrales bacterium]|nr:polysaccharide deacetylase [Candidatus Acidoferrales bacterium]
MAETPQPDYRFPVLFTFDLDAELLWTARDPKNWQRPIALSQGAYGYREGVPRILDLLAKYGLHCTFFVPGMIVERNRDTVRRIHDSGHEISHHSYSHRWLEGQSLAEEREEMEKTIDLIAGVTGSKPAGYRSPAAEFSPNTMNLLLEYGFSYSSNFFDRDAPYKHVVNGKKTDLIEFPFAWVLDDAPFFLYSIQLVGRVITAPSLVLEHWTAEFDGLYKERKCFVLAMHPQIIGRPSRIRLLENLICHVRQHPAAWVARCDEVARALAPVL